MEFITRHLFLFFLGGIGGWIIELFFRRIVHKRWINPGFLTGPCLPLYGSGLCLLYFFSSLDYSFIPSTIGQKIFCIVIMTALVVLLEYLTGLYFLKLITFVYGTIVIDGVIFKVLFVLCFPCFGLLLQEDIIFYCIQA